RLLPHLRRRPAQQGRLRGGVPAAARALVVRPVLPPAVWRRGAGPGAAPGQGRVTSMRILIDILHPAHVHFFRNFHDEMAGRGHDLYITARDKDRSLELLCDFGLPYEQISAQHRRGGLAVEMVQRTRRLLTAVRTFRPDVMTGIMG